MLVRGTAHVLLAFDLGFEIDLAKAEQRLGAGARAGSFKHKGAPRPEAATFGRPLRLTTRVQPPALDGRRPAEELEISLYTFGAVCLTYSLALEQELETLVATSELLYDNAALLEHGRGQARALLEHLGDAVREPLLAEEVEDYVVYGLQAPDGAAAELENEQRELLARVLRAERGALSLHEVENALDGRTAYGPDELVLVDWFAALLIGADMEDERRVLELTTVELVELRFLDGRLERRLEEAYGLLRDARRARFAFALRKQEIERLARFQADSAILHENFDNALKLLGDDYLARLYEIASERFHFGAWDAAIERKLGTLESIYAKLSDQSARRRAEFLEWIIILLFILDIFLLFFERAP
ncbi:MAG: hypothetical protein EXS08_02825 [Planctomycetes bacterium]|nr:hypothetical protein [Planctomycetota bacterium]